MQEYNSFEVVYREMIANGDGLFAHGAPMIFQGRNGLTSAEDRDVHSFIEAAQLWACWMRSEGHDVFDLPRTTRTRDWGLLYSITPQGEESRLYLLTREF